MSIETDLRNTSDGILALLTHLSELESQKRALPSGSPDFVALARRIADLSVEVLRRSEHEADLAETLAERRDAAAGDFAPIDAIAPATRDLQVILDEWRAAERRLNDADGSAPESAAMAGEVRRLREEYRVAFEAARARVEK